MQCRAMNKSWEDPVASHPTVTGTPTRTEKKSTVLPEKMYTLRRRTMMECKPEVNKSHRPRRGKSTLRPTPLTKSTHTQPLKKQRKGEKTELRYTPVDLF